MEIIINIDTQPDLSIHKLQSQICISTLIFTLIVDKFLKEKMNRILRFMPLLSKFPNIQTELRVTKIQHIDSKIFSQVALGGTFDYLHIGHQILLLYSVLASSEKVIIGVTGDGMLINKKNKEVLQSLTVRMKKVEEFVKSINPKLQYDIFELKDPFGPTITDQRIDCLVASPETASSITRINEQRLKRKIKPLQLVVCPLLSEKQDISCKLSSSAIRQQIQKKNGISEKFILEYRQYFDNLTKTIRKEYGTKNKQLQQLWWNEILLRYSEHWRYYHTNNHIYSIFKEWYSQKFVKIRQSLNPKELISLQIALFFHDIIYITTNKDNQRKSAEIAAKFIDQYFENNEEKQNVKKQVTQLIIETQNHVPSSKLSQIVYDLDMGILNSQQGQYKVYARNIKKQYEPILKDKYAEKRSEFLVKTLKQKLHFSFNPQNLHQNIEWELNCIQNEDL